MPYGIYVDEEEAAVCLQYDHTSFNNSGIQFYKQCSTVTVRYMNSNSSVCIKTLQSGTEQFLSREASSVWGLAWLGR